MKRFVTALSLILLLVAPILLTACNPKNPETISDSEKCLGVITLQVVATLVGGGELSFEKLASPANVCVDAVVAAFNTPSNPTPSSPEVNIQSSPSDGTFNASVPSTPWENCTDNEQTVQFNFNVPFTMVVGSSSNQESFTKPPVASSDDNQMVAQQLFKQNSNDIANKTTPGPSQSVAYLIPPHTRVTFTLPLTQS